jgi:hypothetical protein
MPYFDRCIRRQSLHSPLVCTLCAVELVYGDEYVRPSGNNAYHEACFDTLPSRGKYVEKVREKKPYVLRQPIKTNP